jgi:hypothetical protein
VGAVWRPDGPTLAVTRDARAVTIFEVIDKVGASGDADEGIAADTDWSQRDANEILRRPEFLVPLAIVVGIVLIIVCIFSLRP